jgi:signal recognition particle subunit SEC65
MARGWESKSVEDQIDMSERRGRRTGKGVAPAKPAAPSIVDLMRKRETLRLSVTRVTHELESAQNPRYRALLEKSLVDLQIQLARV